MGLTTPVLMESEGSVLPFPMCRALPLLWTSQPVKQVEVFREVNEDLPQLGQTEHVFKEEFLPKDGEMLANIKMEADTVGPRWAASSAWHGQAQTGHPIQATGDRAAVYAVIPTSSGGQGEGLQLPHVVLWAQRVLQVLSTKYTGLFLVTVGDVRATSDRPQLWQRDVSLQLQNVGLEHAFSCFMPPHPDWPMDGRENMFLYGSITGVAYPWQEVPMSMLAGNLWILRSNAIHRGGAITREVPPASTRIIAFAAITTRRVDYDTAMPIILPPWAEAPAQQLSPPSSKAVHSTATQCNRVVKADPPLKCATTVLFVLHMRVNCAQTGSGIRGRMGLLWTTHQLGRMRLLTRMRREQMKLTRGHRGLLRRICAGLRLR